MAFSYKKICANTIHICICMYKDEVCGPVIIGNILLFSMDENDIIPQRNVLELLLLTKSYRTLSLFLLIPSNSFSFNFVWNCVPESHLGRFRSLS